MKGIESGFRTFRKQKYLYLMALPGFIVVLVFCYFPIYGVLIAFKSYNVAEGLWGSPWVGLKHFRLFLNDPFAMRTFRNTLLLGFYVILWLCPGPIILALMLNEVKKLKFKKLVQTVTYFPYFISTVILVGMLKEFASQDGLLNQLTGLFGMEPTVFLSEPAYFRSLYVGSSLWQGLGWGTILYLAALSNADPTQYDAASIDGASRWQKLRYVTWPVIVPTTTILLIIALGGVLTYDYTKVLLMYNPSVYETADVIGTYVYRQGLIGGRLEYSAAVGLMLNVISFLFVYVANLVSRKFTENSLW